MSTCVLRRRAFRAFAEVLNTDHSLAEIAHHCGFYDQGTSRKVSQRSSALLRAIEVENELSAQPSRLAPKGIGASVVRSSTLSSQ
jgi:hypothetical protein